MLAQRARPALLSAISSDSTGIQIVGGLFSGNGDDCSTEVVYRGVLTPSKAANWL